MKVARILIAISICVAASLVYVLVFTGGSSSAAQSTSKTSVNLDGTWRETVPLAWNMVAVVKDNHIQIMLTSDDVNGLYWDGTFNSTESSSSGEIVSTAKQQGLSQNETKVFKYENGELSYDFTIRNQAYRIYLSRGE